MELRRGDLQFVCSRIPRDVRGLMVDTRGLMLAGGFIRSVIQGEKPKDIDLFGPSYEVIKNAAMRLAFNRQGSRLHETQNAITVITPERVPVQFIVRWMYDNPLALLKEFDFTICQAVVWYGQPAGTVDRHAAYAWESAISDEFYPDLAARRLVYTSPKREEAAGGSMMRVRKFLPRGYNIQPSSLAKVIARLVNGIKKDRSGMGDEELAEEISFLLFEVDPLTIIDGLDVIDEHEKVVQD